jgi:hypothetical protein
LYFFPKTRKIYPAVGTQPLAGLKILSDFGDFFYRQADQQSTVSDKKNGFFCRLSGISPVAPRFN